MAKIQHREKGQGSWAWMQTFEPYFRGNDRERYLRAQGSNFMVSDYRMSCDLSITDLFIRINAQLIARRLSWECGGHNHTESMVSCAGVRAWAGWGTATLHNSENGKFGAQKLWRNRGWNTTLAICKSWDQNCISLDMSILGSSLGHASVGQSHLCLCGSQHAWADTNLSLPGRTYE